MRDVVRRISDASLDAPDVGLHDDNMLDAELLAQLEEHGWEPNGRSLTQRDHALLQKPETKAGRASTSTPARPPSAPALDLFASEVGHD